MIDLDDNRLEVGAALRRDAAVNSADGKAAEEVMKLTDGRGVDTAIEAVGMPATFNICEDIVAPGGTIANIGVHGSKVDLHLEKLWIATSRSPRASSTRSRRRCCSRPCRPKKIDPKLLITHRFKLEQIIDAYDTFSRAAATQALKVVIAA